MHISPSPEQFRQYQQGDYNRAAIGLEILADYETPLSCYKKLADAPYSYLLESVEGGEQWGRYSIIGLPADERLIVNRYTITECKAGTADRVTTVDDPLDWIDQRLQDSRIAPNPDLPVFNGGLIGYFGYDIIGYIESHLANWDKADPIGTPDIMLLVSNDFVVFDNLSGKLYLITVVDPRESGVYERAIDKLRAVRARLEQPLSNTPTMNTDVDHTLMDAQDFTASFTEAGYKSAVEQIKSYVAAGDVFQTVPSQRLSVPFSEEPLDLYRTLRSINPSPYMYFFNMGDFHIVGGSPEILARLENGDVTVRPIAGTRHRGKTAEEDAALEADLLADPKELAEHLMLIDLGRNDIGRIAKNGSVKVTDKMTIERYSHVMHIVSNVVGELRNELSAIDVIRATHPAGTLSGAPKIRAMEIIDELEPVKRGIYAGAVGYLSWSGNMDTAIAIRTAVIKDQTLHIQAGGGIVADSQQDDEWEETLNKRRAMFRAISMVKNRGN